MESTGIFMRLYNNYNLMLQNEKPIPKEYKRVLYDIDDGRFIAKSVRTIQF